MKEVQKVVIINTLMKRE